MTWGEATFAVISGLLVNEATDLCPWVAVRLVHWAARLRYLHAPERAATRGEELAALINDRPGKLFKLFTAVGFAVHAVLVAGLRTAPGHARRLRAAAIRLTIDDDDDADLIQPVIILILAGAGPGVVVGVMAAVGFGAAVGVVAGVVVGAIVGVAAWFGICFGCLVALSPGAGGGFLAGVGDGVGAAVVVEVRPRVVRDAGWVVGFKVGFVANTVAMVVHWAVKRSLGKLAGR